jgi:small subunit ribosomal protein S3
MGKKTHPAAIRIDFSGWQNSVWFAKGKTFVNNIKEDYFIRKLAYEFYESGIVCNVTIERSVGNTIVSLHTHRPGILIGEKGVNIENLRKKVLEKVGVNVKINVIEVYRPEANAQFICDQIVKQLVNRSDYKRTAKSCLKFAMKSSIVKGISIIISGRLNGASISRIERFRQGSVALQTFRDKIVYCKKAAKTIYGICGVKVFVSYHQNSYIGGKDVES